jgi:Icc-related predicted phosphoesterase
MRLHVLCDLHLEFGLTQVPRTNADVVVLAGDIHVGREGLNWAREQFGNRPVIYVLGNHEFYGQAFPELAVNLKRETDGSNIHVLENSAVEINGYTFLGCTLWTDFKLSAGPDEAMRKAESFMADYSTIRFLPENRVLRVRDTIGLHLESLAWLRGSLAKCDPARTIIVTHHAPSVRSEAPYHANSPLKAAFASDLDSFIEQSKVPLWIHGHTHYNVDYTMGSTRVLSNQLGYPGEFCKGFDPSMVIEL